MKQKIGEQQAEDIAFLLRRAMKAGSCSFGGYRDTGASSNSIVAIAYGLEPLADQTLPADQSDLMACERMWVKLPEHRKTGNAHEAMNNARLAIQRA